jgi:hypothetical protein
VIPLEEKIERRQLSWLGHITKMDDNRKVKAMPKAGSDKKRKRAVHTSSRQHNILYLGFDIGPLILYTNSRQGRNAPEILDSNSGQKKTLVIESTVTKVRFNDESSMF